MRLSDLTNLLHISTLSGVLSLILPTFNEAANIVNLLEGLDGVLRDTPHEIIVVDDDSPDGTWRIATEFSKLRGSIKVIRRIGKKGLSSAVIDGFDAAHGSVLAVMDADGQHDATLLLRLLQVIEQGSDIAIGSRYVAGGSIGDWVVDRRIISSTGTFFAKMLSQVQVSDPLGGFFALRTDLYRSMRSKLQPAGFKILLEILAHVPTNTRLTEVPLIFRMRLHGESKLSLRVHCAFMGQVLRLSCGRLLVLLRLLGLVFFVLMALVVCVTVAQKLPPLLPLYLDASVRSSVQTSLQSVADKQGWMLSDIELVSVTSASARILHRDHLRMQTASRHCTIELSSSSLACID